MLPIRKALTQVQIEEIKQRYLAGESIRRISKSVLYSHPTIRQLLVEEGVDLRTRVDQLRTPVPKPIFPNMEQPEPEEDSKYIILGEE